MSISVNEVNDAPVLANPGSKTADEKTAISLLLAATDGDVVAGVADSVTYSIVSGSQTGMTLIASTGEFHWTPGESQDGPFTVVFRATDNHNLAGADQTVTITINEVNETPVLANPGDKTVTELESISLSLTASDGDVTSGVSDVVTFSIHAGMQSGMSLDGSTGAFLWTPTDLQAGQYLVTFRATDSHDAVHDQSITITVSESNRPPTDLSLSNTRADENSSDINIGTLSVTDPNASQTHTFTVSDNRFEVVGAVLRLRSGMGLDFEAASSVEFAITATDSGSPPEKITRTFTITVNDVNDPPTEVMISNGATIVERISGGVIASLMAADQDESQSHTYVAADDRFEVVGITLKLKEGHYIVRDESGVVRIDVTATDTGTPPQSITQTIVIPVTENDWPWQNRSSPLDPDADGLVVPQDVLRIINLLNNPTILDESFRLPGSRSADSTAYYYDVNGDGYCTSIDVLRIINYFIASGEGESLGAGDRSFSIAQPSWRYFHAPRTPSTWNSTCPRSIPSMRCGLPRRL